MKKITIGLGILTFCVAGIYVASKSFSVLPDLNKVNGGYGKIENNKYVNKILGFSVNLPSEYSIVKREDADKIVNSANNGGQATKQFTLFMAKKFTDDVPGRMNPNLICITEKLPALSGNYTLKEYGKLSTTNIRKMMPAVKVIKSHQPMTINGREAVYSEYSIPVGLNLNVQQTHYIVKQKQYYIILTSTYFNDKQKKFLEKSVKTLKFENIK